MLVNFVLGHVIWTFGVPIAVVETLAVHHRNTPWLRWPGLTLIVILYALACALVLNDHIATLGSIGSPGQIGGAAVVVALLMAAAFAMRRRAPATGPEPVPAPWLVGVVSSVLFVGYNLLPTTWPGVAASVVILIGVGVAVARLARRAGWEQRHVLAVAAGPLVAYAVLGFVVTPISEPPSLVKYGHNVAMLVLVVVLLIFASRAARRPLMDYEALHRM